MLNFMMFKFFLGKSSQKNKNDLFKLEFCSRINLEYAEFNGNVYFLIPDRKYCFSANLVQKCKISCLR